MQTTIVVQQMLVLFFMMMVGYLSVRCKVVNSEGIKSISALIVNFLNPCMIVSGVVNKEITYGMNLIVENILIVILYFVALIITSKIVIPMMHVKPEVKKTYQLMYTFSNLGFMGIPLISSIYGETATIFVAIYIIAYNLLTFTYGVILVNSGNGEKQTIPWKKLINPGTIACTIAIFLFVTRLQVPKVAGTFMTYMSYTAIACSMMVVGMKVAQSELKTLFTEWKLLFFSLIRLILVPIIFIPIMRLFPIQPITYGIFILMMGMPVGSMVTIIEMNYGGGDGTLSSKGIALTSILSVITIPLVAMLI